jgi:hypothetical protein
MTTNWNKVTKASGTSWTKVSQPASLTIPAGTPIGLLLALTYAQAVSMDIWTKVNKASGTVWTKITKAT